jgi:dTDP-4-amino-4,6-dideoxygalactose transaminase
MSDIEKPARTGWNQWRADVPDQGRLPPIPFIDLAAQRRRLGARLDEAILRVVDHGGYIMGPEVKELEKRLAAFADAKHCISCANGTDALALVLMAAGIGPGDAVFVPAFTFVATAEVVAWVGAAPVFVDVHEDTFNLDVNSLAEAFGEAGKAGLKPRAVIPVDLFGQPADYRAILAFAAEHGLFVLSDAAQSFGARLDNRRVGTYGLATATSFFPAKPLGCYGDGGAVFTDDDELAAVIRSLRVHGQGSNKYDNVRIGLNARLDTLQAAVLMEKLSIFEEEIESRDRIAARYNALLHEVGRVPALIPGASSVWAQYTLVPERREPIAAACKAAGVPTAVYYPIPLSRQTGYRHFPTAPRGVPVSERLSERVISLPMHPYLDEPTQDRIVEAVLSAAGSSGA